MEGSNVAPMTLCFFFEAAPQRFALCLQTVDTEIQSHYSRAAVLLLLFQLFDVTLQQLHLTEKNAASHLGAGCSLTLRSKISFKLLLERLSL
jgi:hypothetical protein